MTAPGKWPNAGAPFSFFPAHTANEEPSLFGRPGLEPRGALEGVVTPGNMQGIKVTHGLTAGDRESIWKEIAEQVAGQGRVLGYVAAQPPLLDDSQAEVEVESAPHLLTAANEGYDSAMF